MITVIKKILKAILKALGLRRLRPAPVVIKDALYEIIQKAHKYEEKLASIKAAHIFTDPGKFWYPYSTLESFRQLQSLLTGVNRQLFKQIEGLGIMDIGAADGDIGFFLETLGFKETHIIEHAPTNANRLEGARHLKEFLQSDVNINDLDLDSFFELPVNNCGLVFLFGTLYHLKNPFYCLETLASCSRYCLLSSKITQLLGDLKTDISHQPAAYLLDSGECNNDVTNYFVFSAPGLKRIIERAGWQILEFKTICGVNKSDPIHQNRSEIAYCLLKSKKFNS